LLLGQSKDARLGISRLRFCSHVPISIKPNPSAAHAGRATPFLSSPAASPTGFGNVKTERAFLVSVTAEEI
jgi:hypothetical protein